MTYIIVEFDLVESQSLKATGTLIGEMLIFCLSLSNSLNKEGWMTRIGEGEVTWQSSHDESWLDVSDSSLRPRQSLPSLSVSLLESATDGTFVEWDSVSYRVPSVLMLSTRHLEKGRWKMLVLTGKGCLTDDTRTNDREKSRKRLEASITTGNRQDWHLRFECFSFARFHARARLWILPRPLVIFDLYSNFFSFSSLLWIFL